jgi:hypothetical protein
MRRCILQGVKIEPDPGHLDRHRWFGRIVEQHPGGAALVVEPGLQLGVVDVTIAVVENFWS